MDTIGVIGPVNEEYLIVSVVSSGFGLVIHFCGTLQEYRRESTWIITMLNGILGIWVPPSNEPNNAWENFKNQLNSWGNLKWKVDQQSNRTTFLDLNVSIQNSTITFSTYQKPLNLYLYLPPLSAHPPSCLKGLIKGQVQ